MDSKFNGHRTVPINQIICKQGTENTIRKRFPNNLRILGGTKRGRKIASPEVYLRPMMSRVRSALFCTLSAMGLFHLTSTRVLDIFSGSGSVGLEALSRGASHATFVDLSKLCIATAKLNAQSLGFGERICTVNAAAEDVLLKPEQYDLTRPYDLITVTPPYEEVDYSALLDILCKSSVLSTNSIVVIEYPFEMGSLPFIVGERSLVGLRNRRYGRTILGIFVHRPDRKFDFRQEEFTIDYVRKVRSR